MINMSSEPPAPPIGAGRRLAGQTRDAHRRRARADRAAALDAWLTAIFPSHLPGVSLLAVGGLGRRDCAPYSDLDLVLLHNGTAGIDRIASALWYPIWDARLGLDHSVRTLPEALSVAHDDVKVALGLLDARHVAGDAALSGELIAAASDQWRRTAVRLMPQLKELTTTRWASHGELAFLLEGDLKEAAGGLRDVTILRGIGRAGVADTMRPRCAPPTCGCWTPGTPCTSPSAAGSTGWSPRSAPRSPNCSSSTTATRCCAGWPATRARSRTRWTTPGGPSDRLRAGAAAGPAGVADPPPGRPGRGRAGRRAGARAYRHRPGPRPQPVAAGGRRGRHRAAADRPRHQRVARRVQPAAAQPVAAGRPRRAGLAARLRPGLLPTWETCDRYGLIDAWLPEWARMRSLPQHHPVHRFTLDRHLVQAAYEATAYAREVDRPDLLLIGAFLHDVGKGLPATTASSAPRSPPRSPPGSACRRPTSPPSRSWCGCTCCCPDVATRRDLSDPVTISTVAERSATAPRSTCCTRWPGPTRTPPARPPGRTGRAG
jgi:[protein-PII] uridylyltransferase